MKYDRWLWEKGYNLYVRVFARFSIEFYWYSMVLNYSSGFFSSQVVVEKLPLLYVLKKAIDTMETFPTIDLTHLEKCWLGLNIS